MSVIRNAPPTIGSRSICVYTLERHHMPAHFVKKCLIVAPIAFGMNVSTLGIEHIPAHFVIKPFDLSPTGIVTNVSTNHMLVQFVRRLLGICSVVSAMNVCTMERNYMPVQENFSRLHIVKSTDVSTQRRDPILAHFVIKRINNSPAGNVTNVFTLGINHMPVHFVRKHLTIAETVKSTNVSTQVRDHIPAYFVIKRLINSTAGSVMNVYTLGRGRILVHFVRRHFGLNLVLSTTNVSTPINPPMCVRPVRRHLIHCQIFKTMCLPIQRRLLTSVIQDLLSWGPLVLRKDNMKLLTIDLLRKVQPQSLILVENTSCLLKFIHLRSHIKRDT